MDRRFEITDMIASLATNKTRMDKIIFNLKHVKYK